MINIIWRKYAHRYAPFIRTDGTPLPEYDKSTLDKLTIMLFQADRYQHFERIIDDIRNIII